MNRDGRGLPTHTLRPGSDGLTRTFDALGRLSTILRDNESVLAQFDYVEGE